jgi:FkbM family methyltransferase
MLTIPSEKQKDISGKKTIVSSIAHAGLTLLLKAGRITRLLPRERGFYKLRNFYQKFLPEGFLVRTAFDGDLMFDLDLRDNIGLYLWHYPDFYEKGEIEAFCASITAGCVVLDVGANVGLYTVLAAKREAKVFAIEADPLNAAMLRHNVKLNGLEDRVTILEIAATDAEKTMPLYRSLPNMGESNVVQKGRLAGSVQGRTIDSLDLPPVALCKMDIEGAELMALMGMQRTLERSPGLKLFVEYAEVFPHSQALLGYLRANFSTLQVIEAPETDPHGDIPDYCNFFLMGWRPGMSAEPGADVRDIGQRSSPGRPAH